MKCSYLGVVRNSVSLSSERQNAEFVQRQGSWCRGWRIKTTSRIIFSIILMMLLILAMVFSCLDRHCCERKEDEKAEHKREGVGSLHLIWDFISLLSEMLFCYRIYVEFSVSGDEVVK